MESETAHVCVKFPLADLQQLDRKARSLGWSRSELLRKLVREVQVIPAKLIVGGDSDDSDVGVPVGTANPVPLSM